MFKNQMNKTFLIIALIICCNFQVFSNSHGNNWYNNLDAALKAAQSKNKFVMLYFSGSDWCRPCMQLKEQVFNSDKFKKFTSKKFVIVNIDFPAKYENELSEKQKKYNEKIADKFNKNGAFPLIVILNKKGKILKSIIGYSREGTDAYIEKLNKIIN